jgi:hypothetical protein
MFVINAFIVFYLLTAWCWGLPAGTFCRSLIGPLSPLIRWLGLNQSWGMFAPDPCAVERDLQVIIKLQSGGALVWEPPRMATLSRAQAFLKFRHREYVTALLTEWGAPCRSALAKYLLRKYDFRDARPIEIVFARTAKPIGPPWQECPPVEPVTRIIFTHRVP